MFKIQKIKVNPVFDRLGYMTPVKQYDVLDCLGEIFIY